jgi:hypothetical protein
VGVGEAVGVVRAGTHMDFRCLAHQVVVVDAFAALAGSDVGQHLGEAAVHAGVNERCAAGVVSAPLTVMAAALQFVWSLKEQLVTLQSATCVVISKTLRTSAARFGRPVFPYGRRDAVDQKDPIV